MQNANPSQHALLTLIGRCLSGQWLIDPTWLYQHADLVARADRGEDMSHVWPKIEPQNMVLSGGVYAAAEKDATIGKGQAFGVINFSGPVWKYGWNSSKSLISALRMMAMDDRIGGVKFIVDSPGGMVSGTREVFEAIQNFPKPVLSVVDGFAASAGYYYIAGSTRIVVSQPNDLVGSIGTYTTIADWKSFYESMGLPVYEIYAAASTQKNEEHRQLIDSKGENTELMQLYITSLNNQFLTDVKAGRGDKLTGKGQDPLAGRLFLPDEAIKNGLIDERISEGDSLGLLADMVATSKQSTIQMGLIDQLVQELTGKKSGQQNDAPSVEQLTAQVTQLTTERDTAQGQITSLTTERDAAQGQITTLTTERDNAQTQVTTLTTERDNAQALAEQYGAQPGEMASKVSKSKDETPKGEGDTKTLAEIIAALPSEIEAAKMGY